LDPDHLEPSFRDLLSRIVGAAPGAYVVGGALRDLLDGRKPFDVDVIVPGDAKVAAEALREALEGHAFVMDAERGQYRVALEDQGGVSTIDIGPLDGDVEANLLQRDFSVNAMAAPIETGGGLGEVIDPCGGLQDLKARRLRMVSEAALRSDPLRLLRAARLATELGYEIEEATSETAQRLAPLIDSAAAERQRDELIRIFATPRAAEGVRLLDRLALLSRLLPELDEARGVEQPGHYHYYDVFDHSVETVAALDALLCPEEPQEPHARGMRRAFDAVMRGYPLRDYLDARQRGTQRLVLLKLAGLLHDIAKPETKRIEASGRIRFYGHPEIGARKAATICRRLRFGNNETRFVAQLVEEHLRPTQLSSGDLPSHRAVYRFFRDLGDAAPACLLLMLADGAAAAGPRLTVESWLADTRYVKYLLDRNEEQSRVIAARPRLITGEDLMAELRLKEGPLVGRLLRSLEEAIGAGEIVSREQALDSARRQLQDVAEESAR
jgi:poly(A) polymerase